MPKLPSQQCYTKLMMSQVTDRADAIDDLAKCIQEKGMSEMPLR